MFLFEAGFTVLYFVDSFVFFKVLNKVSLFIS